MKVGTIVKLKVSCLGNPIGALGVVFYDYGEGLQVIFENGSYDGFNEVGKRGYWNNQSEKDFFLKEISFEPSLVYYQFKNVLQTSQDFRNGVFDAVLKRKEKDEISRSE